MTLESFSEKFHWLFFWKNFDLEMIWSNKSVYLDGVILTVQLVPLALLIGLIIAIPFAVILTSKNKWAKLPIEGFVYFFRGTPLLVQMFLFYNGPGQFEWFRESFLWEYFKEAYFVALFSFSLNTAGYTAEIFRGSLERIPLGQIEAGLACGMSRFQVIKRILLPQALRNSIPSYGNEVIFMLHGSSLAGLITLVDITGAARIIFSRFYAPFEAFITAGILYLLLTLIIVTIFKALETKFLAYKK